MKRFILTGLAALMVLSAGCDKSSSGSSYTPPAPPPLPPAGGTPGSGNTGDGGNTDSGIQYITPENPNIEVQWTLDFEENFDGIEVDKTHWGMYNGGGHNQNGYRKPEAFTVEDGSLVITAKNNEEGLVVSGGMAHNKNYLPIVKWVFRAKCEDDPSETMSGVVLTWPQSNRWPHEGELDIFETLCQANRQPIHSFLHYGASNSQVHKQYDVDGNQWQEMALEWYEDALVIYLNGFKVWTVTDKQVIPKWKHHICLQLDAFKKRLPDGAVVKMYVDYVRVYTGKIVDKKQ